MSENNETNIGRRIYDLRIERDINQGELANAIHLNQSVLNRIEKGTRPARDQEVRDLALFFHVSADTLLGLPTIAAPQPQLTTDEHRLLTHYRALDERGKLNVAETARREFGYLQAQEKAVPKNA